MLKNKQIKKKSINVLFLFMALIITIGTYINIRNSKAEKVIEILANIEDKYSKIDVQNVNLKATENKDGSYNLELPKNINSVLVNNYIKENGDVIKVDKKSKEDTMKVMLSNTEIVNNKINLKTEYDKKETTINNEKVELYNKELEFNNKEVKVTGYMPLDSELQVSYIDTATLQNVKLPNEQETIIKGYNILANEVITEKVPVNNQPVKKEETDKKEATSIEQTNVEKKEQIATDKLANNDLKTEQKEVKDISGNSKITYEDKKTKRPYDLQKYKETVKISIKTNKNENEKIAYKLKEKNTIEKLQITKENEYVNFEDKAFGKYIVTENKKIIENNNQQIDDIKVEKPKINKISTIKNKENNDIDVVFEIIDNKNIKENLFDKEKVIINLNGIDKTKETVTELSEEKIEKGIRYTLRLKNITEEGKIEIIIPENLVTNEDNQKNEKYIILIDNTNESVKDTKIPEWQKVTSSIERTKKEVTLELKAFDENYLQSDLKPENIKIYIDKKENIDVSKKIEKIKEDTTSASYKITLGNFQKNAGILEVEIAQGTIKDKSNNANAKQTINAKNEKWTEELDKPEEPKYKAFRQGIVDFTEPIIKYRNAQMEKNDFVAEFEIEERDLLGFNITENDIKFTIEGNDITETVKNNVTINRVEQTNLFRIIIKEFKLENILGKEYKNYNGNIQMEFQGNNLEDGSANVNIRQNLNLKIKNKKPFAASLMATVPVPKASVRPGINVGDYVNYKPDIVEEQSYGINQEALKWRVLKIYSDGSMDIISNSTLEDLDPQEGVEAFNTGINRMNEAARRLYSNTSKGITARAAKIEDWEKLILPGTELEKRRQEIIRSEYGINCVIQHSYPAIIDNFKYAFINNAAVGNLGRSDEGQFFGFKEPSKDVPISVIDTTYSELIRSKY